MELIHQLTPPLKRLRLSGILETLEVRSQQAADGQWSYIEFLSRLLQDEVERRAQKQLALRLRRAAIDTTKPVLSLPKERWKALTLTSTPTSTASRSWNSPQATTSAANTTC